MVGGFHIEAPRVEKIKEHTGNLRRREFTSLISVFSKGAHSIKGTAFSFFLSPWHSLVRARATGAFGLCVLSFFLVSVQVHYCRFQVVVVIIPFLSISPTEMMSLNININLAKSSLLENLRISAGTWRSGFPRLGSSVLPPAPLDKLPSS